MRMRAVDLFCGTGGFSRGAHAAGIEVAAAFDVDPILTSSFKANFPETELVLKSLEETTGQELTGHARGPIDLMFGGPPCQGFSSIGKRNKKDERRTLLAHFFRLVREVRPRAFVMENVQGLAFADSRPELDMAIASLGVTYEIVGPLVLDAGEFGAATKRKRIFVIGYDRQRCVPITKDEIQSARSTPATVADALSGLGAGKCVDGERDTWRIPEEVLLSRYAQNLAADDRTFTGNKRTNHTSSVQRRFSTVPQGGIDKIGRHPRLSWAGQCPTLRAGTGADVGSYQSVRPLHPEEDRVITVREAARLQGFPDSHIFHPTIWHSFRMIGNSVSPIIAQAVLGTIAEKLEMARESKKAT